MKAILFPGDRRAALVDMPAPTPPAGFARLRMTASGICGTDLHRYRLPARERGEAAAFVSGHEAVGIVDAVGAGVDPGLVNRRCVVWHIWGCQRPDGPCPDAVASGGKYCPHGAVMAQHAHGANAQWQSVPARVLLPLPERFSDPDGVVLACNYGTGWRAVVRGGVAEGQRVAVWGLGPVGLSAVQVALSRGADVVGMDLYAARRRHAEALGAVAATGADDLSPGARFDVIIDTTGQGAVQSSVLNLLRHDGTLVLVGLGPRTGISPTSPVTLKELRLVGSLVYDLDEWDQLLGFCRDAAIDLGAFISHTVDLPGSGWDEHEVTNIYKAADAGETGKVVFLWEKAVQA